MFPVTLSTILAVILAFIVSFAASWFSIPRISKFCKRINLTDKTTDHQIHNNGTPSLGGVAIFLGFTFGFLLTVNNNMPGVTPFMVGVLILFFTGIKDDLVSVFPWYKILVQIVSGLIICFFTTIRITNLHGFLGISEISVLVSFIITLLLFVVIVNSFNLIDGIDGLASSVGIIVSTTYGIWFWISHDYGYAVMSASLSGALLIFLPYNLSNRKNKIFMGDTGSLMIGFILTVMTIRFNEINVSSNSMHSLHSSPSVSIAILIVPLFDAMRVVLIRFVRKTSIFNADNRHIHHMMLRAGFSHFQSTLLISVVNLIIILIGFLFDGLGIIWMVLMLLLISVFFTTLIYIKVARIEKWDWERGIINTILKNDKPKIADVINLPK